MPRASTTTAIIVIDVIDPLATDADDTDRGGTKADELTKEEEGGALSRRKGAEQRICWIDASNNGSAATTRKIFGDVAPVIPCLGIAVQLTHCHACSLGSRWTMWMRKTVVLQTSGIDNHTADGSNLSLRPTMLVRDHSQARICLQPILVPELQGS